MPIDHIVLGDFYASISLIQVKVTSSPQLHLRKASFALLATRIDGLRYLGLLMSKMRMIFCSKVLLSASREIFFDKYPFYPFMNSLGNAYFLYLDLNVLHNRFLSSIF